MMNTFKLRYVSHFEGYYNFTLIIVSYCLILKLYYLDLKSIYVFYFSYK